METLSTVTSLKLGLDIIKKMEDFKSQFEHS